MSGKSDGACPHRQEWMPLQKHPTTPLAACHQRQDFPIHWPAAILGVAFSRTVTQDFKN